MVQKAKAWDFLCTRMSQGTVCTPCLKLSSKKELLTNPFSTVHQGGSGLGANSTFLETVWESDQAPSKAVGMWIGSEAQSDPHNGLVVIGGYDSSRKDGEFTEFEYENLCPACVHVESMTFDWDGDSTPLMDEDAGDMKVLLNPYWHDLLVGPSMFNRFMDITNGTYTLGLGIHWRTEETPLGNITITLRGGYKTVIPPEVFFRFARGYREDGSFEILGDELLVASMSNFSDETLMPHWGIPFMTMNYLLIDHQNEEFKMAPARQGNIEQDPVIEPVCFSGSGSGSSSNAGPIAGGVIGGLAGLALLAFAVWWFWWRKRKGARSTAMELPEEETPAPNHADSKDEKPQELSSATEKFELAPSSTFASEMASPEQMRFSPDDKSNVQELASPEQMNGAIYGQLAKQGTVDSAITGVPLVDSANAKEMPAEPVEMAADIEKPNR